MEGRKVTEQDFDEFEMLLGEIPNAMSGNSQPGISTHTRTSLPETQLISLEDKEEKSSAPIAFTNLFNSSQATENEAKTNFYRNLNLLNSSYDRNLQSSRKLDHAKTDCNGHVQNVDQDESNLLDERFLTSTLEGLRFKDGVTIDPTLPASTYNKNQPNHLMLFVQYNADTNKPISGLESANMPISSFPSASDMGNLGNPSLEACCPLTKTNGINNAGVNSPDEKSLKHYVHEPKNQIPEALLGDLADQRQSSIMYSRSMPVAPGNGTHAFSFPLGVQTSGLEFPSPSFQQQYYWDAQSQAYLPSQHINSSHMAWQNTEDRYFRLDQQYFYRQQLQNQGSRTHSGHGGNGFMESSGVPIQPYLQMHLTQPYEQSYQELYWNNGYVHRRLNQLDVSLMGNSHCCYLTHGFCGRGDSCASALEHTQKAASGLTYFSRDLEGAQILDKVGKHIFPEKILTRSQGLNSVRTLKSAPTGFIGSQLANPINPNGRVLSNGHLHHYPLPAGKSFHSESHYLEGLFVGHSSRSLQPKFNSLDEVVGKIYSTARDQLGCRFLQKKVNEGKQEDLKKIFDGIIGHIAELMIDPFGNYLVQKVIEKCHEDQRMLIICAITKKDDLINISCDTHGTRAVQKVIETLKTPEQSSMVASSLKSDVVKLMKDANGNHVAQRCLQHLLPAYNEFLFDAAVAHCRDLATDRQGCCVLQKCLHYSDGERKDRLVSEIISNAFVLSQDQYGNYVVQYALDLKIPRVTTDVLDQLHGKYSKLSMQKYSSNVVEKCLDVAGNQRVDIIQELMNCPKLAEVLQDQYGNYVIQSALDACKGALHSSFLEAIRPHISTLRSSHYGKRIISKTRLKM